MKHVASGAVWSHPIPPDLLTDTMRDNIGQIGEEKQIKHNKQSQADDLALAWSV